MEKPKILVVDDEPFILRSLAFVLKKAGYTVLSATDGEEALEILQQGDRPQIMFLDVMMPKKNGFEVCQFVKSHPHLRDIYVILLTAKGQESDKEKGLAAGADDYITKPFSPSKLLEKLDQILKSKN